jgi:NAD(P)H-flavin reductase
VTRRQEGEEWQERQEGPATFYLPAFPALFALLTSRCHTIDVSMAIPVFTIACTRKKRIATDVYEFVFTKPAGFTFKAGQFVLFDVPHPENPSDIQTRAFSIASSPGESDMLFVVKLVTGGRASAWFEKAVEEGSEATIKGPFGNFLLDPTPDRRILFIATSTGNAPFRSQILDAIGQGDTRRMDLIYGVRSEADLFWKEEFEAMAARAPNFFLHLTLSQPSEAWTGHRGRVQTVVPQITREFANILVYACGSPVMTKDIKQLALEQWGMERKSVHVEGYI